MNLQLGTQVRVNVKHWARGNALGTVTEINPERLCPYLVTFDVKGIGIEDGTCLWLGEWDLSAYASQSRKAPSVSKGSVQEA